MSCSEHGSCSLWYDTTPYCQCHPGYHPIGLACEPNDEADPCAGIDCALHGACTVSEGIPSCICDFGYQPDPSGLLCFTDLDTPPVSPFDRAPGQVVEVTGLSCRARDLLRSREGTLLLTANSSADPSSVKIARSTDSGSSWSITELPHNNEEGGVIDLYGSRLFFINDEHIGVSAIEGTMVEELTYHNRIRYTSDDGRSFNDDWIAVSNFADSSNDQLVVTSLDSGGFLASFVHGGAPWIRSSESLDEWPTEEPTISLDAGESYPSFVHVGDRLLLALSAANGVRLFEHAPPEDFQEIGRIDTSAFLSTINLHWDAEAEELLACGCARSGDRREDRVYVYRSRDHGASWEERLYLPPRADVTSCYIDETGTYVLYRDDETDRVILPGDPAACGNGVTEPGEECDGEDFIGASCLDYRLGAGELRCIDCAVSAEHCEPFDGALDCQDIEPRVDGFYEIDPDGVGSNPPFEVWCQFTQIEEQARAYIQLNADNERNYSLTFYETRDGMNEERCFFERVYLSEPRKLTIDGRDQRFAQCPTDTGDDNAVAAWGQAWACTRGENPDGSGPRLPIGEMNVDLTGTPFVFNTDYFTWTISGWMETGNIETISPGLIMEATGGGDCGGAIPDPQIRLRFAGE